MTEPGLPTPQKALASARERILAVLEGCGASQEGRAAVHVALAELSAAIEGVPSDPACRVCGRAVEAHSEREVHDCATEGRAQRMRAATARDYPPRRCTAHEWRDGPQCLNDVAPDKISLCAGPHVFEPATPAHIEAKGKLNPGKPPRKLALVVSAPRDRQTNDSAAPSRGPGEPR